jgi:hypothetical protein
VAENKLPEPPEFSIQQVTPTNIGFSKNLGNWVDNKEFTIMDPLLIDIAKQLSIRSAFTILRSMYERTGLTAKSEIEGKLSKTDIAKLDSQMASKGWFADTLIIHPEQKLEFLYKNEIWLHDKISNTKFKGNNYVGMLGNLDVFWTPLVKDMAFVYDKEQIFVAATPLKINFDKINKQLYLKIEQTISAAPVDSRGVGIVTLK